MSRDGVCETGVPPSAGNCASDLVGSFGAGMTQAQCTARCQACERCRFASWHPAGCTWHHECPAALSTHVPDARTVRVRPCDVPPRCHGVFRWKHSQSWCRSRCGRVAVLLLGEAFRQNRDNGDRELGTPSSVDGQRLATASHAAHVLRHERFERVDVFLDTYSTRHDALLLGGYAEWLRPGAARFRNASAYTGVQSQLDFGNRPDAPPFPAAVYNGGYDGLLVMRPDLVLKPAFATALTHVDLSRVVFAFEIFSCAVDPEPGHLTPKGRPLVADVLVWVPKPALNRSLRIERWFRNHYALDVLPPRAPRPRLLIGTQHQSNPLLDLNPLYSFAARRELPVGELRHGYEGKHHREQRDCWDHKLAVADERERRARAAAATPKRQRRVAAETQ